MILEYSQLSEAQKSVIIRKWEVLVGSRRSFFRKVKGEQVMRPIEVNFITDQIKQLTKKCL